MDEYDPNGEHPQVHVEIRQVVEGLKLQMFINEAAQAALAGADGGLSLHEGSGLFVGDVEIVANHPGAQMELGRLEINTGR